MTKNNNQIWRGYFCFFVRQKMEGEKEGPPSTPTQFTRRRPGESFWEHWWRERQALLYTLGPAAAKADERSEVRRRALCCLA